jgi:hypothetical protein
MKKLYKSPSISTEPIKIGVFGSYNSTGGNGWTGGTTSGSGPANHFNWGWFFVARHGRNKRR